METRYKVCSGSVCSLKYHVVWCPKYRRSVLTGQPAERLNELLLEKCSELGFTVHALEVMPDHVHMFVETDPRWCPAEIAQRLKGFTSSVLRKEFPEIRSRLPTLWSRSYFIASVGSVTDAAVRAYIEDQKGK